MKKEKWKPIIEYPYYEASNLGNVRSLDKVVKNRFGSATKRGKVLQKCLSGGYYRTGIMSNGKLITPKISVLVALAWHPNPENKRCVNHKDTNKLNDCEWNLEWNTHQENSIHARKNNCWRGYRHSAETISKIVVKSQQRVVAMKDGEQPLLFISLKKCAEYIGYPNASVTTIIKRGNTTRNGYKLQKL